ncbi:MAG: hypothetical protein SV377_05535, partial [Halobacteria archaeon]|nr:hypothetical protein [Halobacteria archaeon]
MGLGDHEGKLRTATKWSPFVTLLVPWIYYSYPSGYTIVFSVGFTNSFRNFVDIWNWTFNYTQGAFTSAY